MARRRRRGRFNRVSPDMGWWVDSGFDTFQWAEANGSSVYGTGVSTIQFGDITDDDSLITRDNSDWFIKRVLVEAFPTLVTEGGQLGDTKRIWTMAMGTIDNTRFADWIVNQDEWLQSPEAYEMWARLFRQYNRPVYRPHSPKVVVGSAFTGAVAVNTASTENYIFAAGLNDWGHSAIVDDFTVSNAGMRPEQSLALAFSGQLSDAFDIYRWDTGDELGVRWNLRVLLQKRRGA